MHAEKSALRTATYRFQSLIKHLPALTVKLLQEVVSFIYPPTCAGCAKALDSGKSEHFCRDCLDTLDLISEPYCPQCGIPYVAEAPRRHLCGDCLTGVHHFDRARTAGFYRGLVREVVHRFKYSGQIYLARPLARMLASPGKELNRLHKIDLIVPVPLHSKRLRQRGFNQASLLARHLGYVLRMPVNYSSLKRTRWTAPQTGLSRRQRAKNVKGAFSLKSFEKIKGKGVLLLDDVLTTGETVNQCVRVLKKHGGAREVVVLTVARTVAW